MPVFLNAEDADFEEAFMALLGTKREDSPDVDSVVAKIIADVRARGDDAVIDLTKRFDRMSLRTDQLRFTEAEIDALIAEVPDAEREALELAADRIRSYHERQLPRDESWTDAQGAMLGWR